MRNYNKIGLIVGILCISSVSMAAEERACEFRRMENGNIVKVCDPKKRTDNCKKSLLGGRNRGKVLRNYYVSIPGVGTWFNTWPSNKK